MMKMSCYTRSLSLQTQGCNKGYSAVTRGLVLPNGKVVKVNDPTWVGDTIKLVNKYELPKLIFLTLPNVIKHNSMQLTVVA